MTRDTQFEVRLATIEADILGAQRLRYQVFVEELGGDGDLVDHKRRFERDSYDPLNDHLVLVDRSRSEQELEHVVGVYRLLDSQGAAKAGGFYSEGEYDLSKLKSSERTLLELGRSCLHPEIRGGTAMFHLWSALAQYVADNRIEIMFGTASFHGTDVTQFAPALSLLHHRHLAPEGLRVRACAAHFQTMNLIAEEDIDRRAAMVQIPALIKAYLRLGGVVGEGAFVDHAFNTTDVCLVMDTAQMTEKHRKIYDAQRAGQQA